MIPEWKARLRRPKDWDSEFCSPNVMVPRQSLETVKSGARLKTGTPILQPQIGNPRKILAANK